MGAQASELKLRDPAVTETETCKEHVPHLSNQKRTNMFH